MIDDARPNNCFRTAFGSGVREIFAIEARDNWWIFVAAQLTEASDIFSLSIPITMSIVSA
jgi:hypothetical protein